MPRSSKLFLFPDVNVWIALSYDGHVHHKAAQEWFSTLDENAMLCFCRITQISFLRLLTTAAILGRDVLTQASAWETFDAWMESGRVLFLDEPAGLEHPFRQMSEARRPSPKDWTDSYLAAFASIAGLRLVTFDRSFLTRTTDAIVLRT